MDIVIEASSAIVILLIVLGVLALVAYVVYRVWKARQGPTIPELLKRHFAPTPMANLAVSERRFPPHIRADLHRAVESFLKESTVHAFSGLKGAEQSPMSGADFPSLFKGELMWQLPLEAPQYEEIDVGEDEPARSLANGLWLLSRDGQNFAVLYAHDAEFGDCGFVRHVRFQVAVRDDVQGVAIAKRFFAQLEQEVARAASYRGKILSLEVGDDYRGQVSGVKVHRLGKLRREDVILPARTLELLERNAVRFAQKRSELGRYGLSRKKGLLFYGPPGTGKTHTIRWLAGSLEGHTTLLISGEQVGRLAEYMTLARLLQPSLVVIEDVDLIARSRSHRGDPGVESLLNKLLNELDGLNEDCDVLTILTTNRPEELEAALAARPGRIDQAIEFPLPDDEGRDRLVRLYGRGCDLSDELVEAIVRRTEKVSASFIKELMRRSMQFRLEHNGTGGLSLDDVDRALDEMLFAGGSLNLKLLGAEGRLDGNVRF